jgi:GTP-binding protein
MIVRSAEFITSAVKPDQYPPESLPEIAFAGRSNAGKSSLINALVNRKNLAKTSSTPGKTRLINFFTVNNAVYFVDLPGYGYAKVSQSERRYWKPMVESYLSSRKTIRGVVIISDIRRIPGAEEIELMGWLANLHIPAIVISSKADKLSKNEQFRQRRAVSRALSTEPEELILFSAKTRQGMDNVWEKIEAVLL